VKKFLLVVFVIGGIAISGLTLIVLSFNFASMEGRGSEAKKDVKFAFREANSIEGVESYVLTQGFDEVRNRAVLSVNGRFWSESDQVIGIRGIGVSSFSGDNCIAADIGGLFLSCADQDNRLVQVCPTSLIEKSPTLFTIEGLLQNYDLLFSALQSYPDQREINKNTLNSNIPRLRYGSLYKEKRSSISCWVSKLEAPSMPPIEFDCGDQFHMCSSSDDIKLVPGK